MFFLSAVTAADNVTGDVVSADAAGEIGIVDNQKELNGVSDNGTFQTLQKRIDDTQEGSTLTLENDYLYDGDFNNASQIIISKSLTIDGKGYSIDANKKSGIFNVTADNVVIKNITFLNGNSTFGGAICFSSSTGSVIDCYFINNTADNGGAIYADNTFSDSTINSTFINNSAKNGGAIYFNGEINNVLINGCFKDNGAVISGGAIYVWGQAHNNNFSSEFYSNRADNLIGGAISFNNLSENNCFESIFKDNYAPYGGAIFFYNKTNHNKFKCEFMNNTAKSCGGAIFFYDTTSNNSFAGKFSENHALGQIDENGNGGAITFKDISANSTFSCDFINNTAAKTGGGVNYRLTPYNITFNSSFINNNASVGGAVNFFESFENVIFNGEFTGNSAVNGGAIAVMEAIVRDVSFKNNHAGNGGAVYFEAAGEIINCNFTANTADYGGSAYFNNAGTVTDCNFGNNTAEYGGAVYICHKAIITNCNFTGNRAANGSAIYFFDSANSTVSDSYFLNNKANYNSLQLTVNENNIEITFTGNDNLLNAMYSRKDVEITFNNVTYWGASGIENTGIDFKPSVSANEAGLNISVVGVIAGNIVNTTEVTDSSGKIVLKGSSDYMIIVRHDEDSYFTGVEKIFACDRTDTILTVDAKLTRVANDYNAGERGNYFYAVLKDVNGNRLVNKTVQIAFNGIVYSIRTDGKGQAGVKVDMANAGTYTYAFLFMGDEKYNAAPLVSSKLTVTAKKTGISASSKTFKKSVKVKSYRVILKTGKNPYDGKTYLSAGKKITLKVNGKTYTSKTNSKGVAKFSLKLTRKGKFTAKIKFAGDKTYRSCNKSVKITIK